MSFDSFRRNGCRRCRGRNGGILGGSETPLCNPALAIISQSKRFHWFGTVYSCTCRRGRHCFHKHSTCATFRSAGFRWNRWYSSSSSRSRIDMIKMHGLTAERYVRQINRSIRRHPKLWVAQERFGAVPLSTSLGSLFPCIGVYTLNGRVIGGKGRCLLPADRPPRTGRGGTDCGSGFAADLKRNQSS